eukprot:2858874-Pyramimonas_sp.AAC.1
MECGPLQDRTWDVVGGRRRAVEDVLLVGVRSWSHIVGGRLLAVAVYCSESSQRNVQLLVKMQYHVASVRRVHCAASLVHVVLVDSEGELRELIG